MARGFESKDVEFQQAEAERRKTVRNRSSLGRAPSREEREAQARLRTLELALANLRADREAATSRAHCQMLDAAIADLEAALQRCR